MMVFALGSHRRSGRKTESHAMRRANNDAHQRPWPDCTPSPFHLPLLQTRASNIIAHASFSAPSPPNPGHSKARWMGGERYVLRPVPSVTELAVLRAQGGMGHCAENSTGPPCSRQGRKNSWLSQAQRKRRSASTAGPNPATLDPVRCSRLDSGQ